MMVKFNKKQIKALAAIHSRAVAFFNEEQSKNPHLYREEDRNTTIRCFESGILKCIVETGEAYLED